MAKIADCWLHSNKHCTPTNCVAFTDKSTGGNGCLILDGVYSFIQLVKVLSQPTYFNRK